MKKEYLISYIVFLLFIDGNAQYKTGVVLDSVNKMSEFGNNGFALYLPEKYNRLKPYGLVFFFDPAGRGEVPIDKYRSIAKNNNLILIGLNDSKNGSLNKNLNAFIQTWEWLVKRFLIETNRVYLIGFSGGARTASYISQKVDFKFAGIIGCGAGFYSRETPKHSFNYVGIVGNEDMNYYELTGLNKQLLGAGWDTFLLTFDGGHHWCPEKLIISAMEKINFTELKGKSGRIVKKNIIQSFNQKVEELEKINDLWEKYTLTVQLINFYDGLIDITNLKSKLLKLESSIEIQQRLIDKNLSNNFYEKNFVEISQVLERIKLAKDEKDLKKSEGKWWGQKIKEVEKFGRPESMEVFLMKTRLFSFLDFYLVEHGKRAIQNGNLMLAIKYFKIFSIIRENDYVPQLKISEVYARMNDKKNSLRHLKNAIDKGFYSKKEILNNETLKILHNHNEFSKLIVRLPSYE